MHKIEKEELYNWCTVSASEPLDYGTKLAVFFDWHRKTDEVGTLKIHSDSPGMFVKVEFTELSQVQELHRLLGEALEAVVREKASGR